MRKKLPLRLCEFVTGTERYVPAYEFDPDSRVTNIVRRLEQVFGRRTGIVKEQSLMLFHDGRNYVEVRRFFTITARLRFAEAVWSSWCARLEESLKSPRLAYSFFLLAALSSLKSLLAAASGLPVFVLGAIARGNYGTNQSLGGTASVSIDAGSGSGRIIFVSLAGQNSGMSSATYAGSSMTQIASEVGNGSNRFATLFYRASPASGTNSATGSWSGANWHYVHAVVYSGVDTSSPIDVSGTTSSTSASFTTTTNDTWGILVTYQDSFTAVGTNTTLVIDNGEETLLDSGGSLGSAGSKTMSWSGTGTAGGIYAAFKPQPGTNYTLTLTDSATAADSFTKTLTRTLSEARSAVDTRVMTLTRVLTESQAATDTLAALRVFVSTLTETAAAADSLVRSIVRTLTETPVASDTLTKVKSMFRTYSESATATDTVTRLVVLGRTFVESVSISDIVLRVLNGSSTIWTDIGKSAAATWTKTSRSASALWTKISKGGQ